MKTVLTIAGSDSSGGAGIQADIKTVTAHGLFATSAITALTAQNTTGVYGIYAVDADFVKRQLDCIFNDIYPDAVKIGMLSDESVIAAVCERLSFYKAKNIVLDPVMVSTSGSRLLTAGAEKKLTELFRLAAVITPNIPEAERLLANAFNGTENYGNIEYEETFHAKILNENDMRRAAITLSNAAGCAVLVKGGHLIDGGTPCCNSETNNKKTSSFTACENSKCQNTDTDSETNGAKKAVDCLAENGILTMFSSGIVKNPNTHGTGCTLSSAIACGLANGKTLKESIAAAKKYLAAALNANLNLGKGRGPLNHMVKTDLF
ncbi:MAG: hydroxymethylpyrimidine/phosphomethylpyrimidine kinase [Clostridiales bacterium]|jgi:hydroxymethylpyrimidine/phosphomethylpyrimidine kinase|nr:hydroxymethylpyrimidine/phosphomethylpyrimidine kinase [Clostridiales bacterium]